MEQPQYDAPLPDPIYPEPYSPAPAPIPVYDPATGQPKSNKTMIIIIVVVAVLLLCCCCFGIATFVLPALGPALEDLMYEFSMVLPQLLAG